MENSLENMFESLNDSRNHLDIMPECILPNGEYDPKFENFATGLSEHIANFEYEELYEISDKILDKDAFINYIKDNIGNDLEQWLNLATAGAGLVLSKPLNQIIRSFDLVAYKIEHRNDDIINQHTSYIKTYQTKLYFRFKDSKFQLMSVFNKFQDVETQI